MSEANERRERYAMAIMSAGGAAYPLDYYAVEAPAAMAVADAERENDAQELDRLGYALSIERAESARLRAELADARREIETLEDMFREQG